MLMLIGMIGCVLGIVLSYIFKNEAITALGYNMDDSTAYTVSMAKDEAVEYNLLTQEKLLGVQVRLTNFNKEISEGRIHYEVTSREDGHTLGSSFIPTHFVDGNYIFMPFEGFETCIGSLKLTLWCEDIEGKNYPGVYVNKQKIPDTNTSVNGKMQEGNLLIIYNTPIYNKPLLWDFTMMLFIFFTIFVMVDKGRLKKYKLLNKARKREPIYESVEK